MFHQNVNNHGCFGTPIKTGKLFIVAPNSWFQGHDVSYCHHSSSLFISSQFKFFKSSEQNHFILFNSDIWATTCIRMHDLCVQTIRHLFFILFFFLYLQLLYSLPPSDSHLFEASLNMERCSNVIRKVPFEICRCGLKVKG